MQDSTEATEIGRNRTGLQASPQLSKEMNDVVLPVAAETADASPLNEVRVLYIREADPLGSIPPPATDKGRGQGGSKASERRAAAGLCRQARPSGSPTSAAARACTMQSSQNSWRTKASCRALRCRK